MTPSQVMIDALENESVDDFQHCMIIFVRSDGSFGYRVGSHGEDQSLFDSISMVNFARLSLEHDLRGAWEK